MPMPLPGKEESRQDYVSRFMANQAMIDEYPDAKQRAAVAYQKWRDKSISGTIDKSVDKAYKFYLTKSLSPDGDYLTGIATAEIVDLEGDLIEVDGIDLSIPNIKVCPCHAHELPDGKPSVMGTVVKLWKDKVHYGGEEVKALFFRMRWADTDLAKAWRPLYEDGTLDSFSVGLAPDRSVARKMASGGIRYPSSVLAEISGVVVGANQLAKVQKSLSKFLGSDYFRQNHTKGHMATLKKDLVSGGTGVVDPGKENPGEQNPNPTPLAKNVDGKPGEEDQNNAILHKEFHLGLHKEMMGHVADCVDKCYGTIKKDLDTHMESIHERLDNLESATVADDVEEVPAGQPVQKQLIDKKLIDKTKKDADDFANKMKLEFEAMGKRLGWQ